MAIDQSLIATNKIAKPNDRMNGRVFAYVHFNGQLSAMVKISTITDFAARTEEFALFGKDIAMHVASSNPKDYFEFYEQLFVKDPTKIIKAIFDEMSQTLGEKVEIVAYSRFDF